ncbi:MAG: hypothetical protein HKN20_08620 [Gemmatimonadetes bacterium]|nr:hypothetical protein [Gemmatimonadota bacterium]
MLQSMRQNTKIVLWIVMIGFLIFTFAVWGADMFSGSGQQTASAIGKVNGRPVSYEEYNRAYDQEVEAYRGTTDLPVLPSVAKALEEQAWERCLNQAIIDKELKARKIVVSDEEIVHAIRTTPPDFVQSQEVFQTEGRFDYQKYISYVNDPNIDWRWLEDYFRAQLPINHLQQQIAMSTRVTDAELQSLYKQSNETVDFSFVAFLPGEFEDRPVTVSEEDVTAWYEKNKERFRVEEEAILDYVVVPIEATANDRERTLSQMNEIVSRLEQGTPFEDLARYYSQGPTAQQGGELGVFQKGSLTPEIEEKAFALEEGDVSEIIENEEGFQILTVTSREESDGDLSVGLRQILLTVEPKGETIEEVRSRVEGIREAAEDGDFGKAVVDAGLTARSTGPFPEGNFIPTVGNLPPANVFAFTAEIGDVSEPVLHNDGYYVFHLAHRDSSRLAPLEEVQLQARQGAENQARLTFARDAAKEAMKDGASLEDIAKANDRAVKVAKLISRRGTVPGIGADLGLILSAFDATPGEVSGPAHTEFGSFLIRTDKVNAISDAAFQREKPSLVRSLLYQRQDAVFSEWLEMMRDKAKVEDYRTPADATS